MKKKKKIIILLVTLSIIVSLFFLYYVFYFKKDTLNIQEKQWIDQNKNNVIDISVLNNVPMFTYNGEGVLFDYLNYISKNTNLSFNPSSFNLTDTSLNNYAFTLKNKKQKDDLLIYRDNYILIKLDGSKVTSLSELKDQKIGVLKGDKKRFSKYFSADNIQTFNSKEELFTKEDIGAVIILKSDSWPFISSDKNISYQFLGETKDYVITLNGDETLNSIMKKYFDIWKDEYQESYDRNLLQTYYKFFKISDIKQTNLKAKSYVYGFVEDGIFDNIVHNKLKGINNLVLRDYASFADIEIKYKKYSKLDSLIHDFNNGKIDIMFNNSNLKINDGFSTLSSIDSKLVAVSNINKSVPITNVNDLSNYHVVTIGNSKIASYLDKHNIKYESYSTFNKLLHHLKSNDVVVIDIENYNQYKTRNFRNYKIDCILDDISYAYMINNNSSNDTFKRLFAFYSEYNNLKSIVERDYKSIGYKTVDYYYIFVIIVVSLLILVILVLIDKLKRLLKKKRLKKRTTLTKEEKLKYIDQLTSLKNRAYLNSKVEKWDESQVYPQCVIIIDLNNIAYINDNYGREEGDKIILQAANILITSQLPNSEIIRTDGNEFLIYLVGYPEKTVIAYLRKLGRLFKTLDHGFGAAYGYSMLLDAIKTFDDAVNEATLDMKNNKDGTSNI